WKIGTAPAQHVACSTAKKPLARDSLPSELRYSCRRWSRNHRDRTACCRVFGAVCSASTQRKENYGYCQESEEIREEAGREKGPREETCGEKGPSEESSRKESSCEETRSQEVDSEAQAECRVHEADDPVGNARRRRRFDAQPPHRCHQENLGLHQEEQAARQYQSSSYQRRRKAPRCIRGKEAGLDVRNDEARLEPSQVTAPPPPERGTRSAGRPVRTRRPCLFPGPVGGSADPSQSAGGQTAPGRRRVPLR